MIIKKIPIKDIKTAAYNPRGDPQYEHLKKSIKEFDLVEPLVWNKRSGNLVGGHQRLKILIERGDTEAEVSVVDFDPIREKACNIALNKIQGDWDDAKLYELLKEIKLANLDLEIAGFTDDDVAKYAVEFEQDKAGLTEKDLKILLDKRHRKYRISTVNKMLKISRTIYLYTKRLGIALALCSFIKPLFRKGQGLFVFRPCLRVRKAEPSLSCYWLNKVCGIHGVTSTPPWNEVIQRNSLFWASERLNTQSNPQNCSFN
jgi:hypothetical protein